MTGDPVTKETMAYAHLSDMEVASKVRMLFRDQLDHEAVCVGGRDRIMFLSQRVAALETRLQAIGDIAHARSAGPAIHDDLWEVRGLAYELL